VVVVAGLSAEQQWGAGVVRVTSTAGLEAARD
jgi:hypothetical protein